MTSRQELQELAERRRLALVSWMADRNSKLRAISHTRAYHDMALLCSTPCWDMGPEERKSYTRLLKSIRGV